MGKIFLSYDKYVVYIHTQSIKPFEEFRYFSWYIYGILHTPIERFWYSYFSQGSTIVQSYFLLGTILCGNTTYLYWLTMREWSLLALASFLVFWELEIVSYKPVENRTVKLFSGCMKVGLPIMIYLPFNTSNWHRHSTYIPNKALCNLGMGHGFAWYSLVPCCSSMSTSLVFHVLNVTSNKNSYLTEACVTHCPRYLPIFCYLMLLYVSQISHSDLPT